jgi:hypothetical protein
LHGAQGYEEARLPSKPIEGPKPEKKLALSRLEPAIGLIDDVKAAASPHHAIVAMALAQGPERVLDLHW